MIWTVEIEASVERELDKLDPQHAKRILRFLFERVAISDNPRNIGEPLKGTRLGHLWKYRVGDYRVISHIEDKIARIIVVGIGDRKEIYR